MAAPFALSTWITRSTIPFGAGNVVGPSLIVSSPRVRRPVWLVLTEGIRLWRSGDHGIVWSEIASGVFASSILSFFFNDQGLRPLYFVWRHVGSTLILEASDDGAFFSPWQVFNNFPGPASVGGPMEVPGSGPNGENALWVILSSGTSVTLWRSIDIAQTWVQIRDLTSTPPFAAAVRAVVVRSPSGRWIGLGSSFSYSDDLGVTWTASAGLPGFSLDSIAFHSGNTSTFAFSGSLGAGASLSVSCDDGANFVGAGSGLSGGNGTQPHIRYMSLGAQEALVVTTEADVNGTRVFWSDNGGETVVDRGVLSNVLWILSQAEGGHPVLITKNGLVRVSADSPRGSFTQRTTCPLASAGLRKSAIPVLCGHPITQSPCG